MTRKRYPSRMTWRTVHRSPYRPCTGKNNDGSRGLRSCWARLKWKIEESIRCTCWQGQFMSSTKQRDGINREGREDQTSFSPINCRDNIQRKNPQNEDHPPVGFLHRLQLGHVHCAPCLLRRSGKLQLKPNWIKLNSVLPHLQYVAPSYYSSPYLYGGAGYSAYSPYSFGFRSGYYRHPYSRFYRF